MRVATQTFLVTVDVDAEGEMMRKAACVLLGPALLVACSSDPPTPTAPLSLPVVEQGSHAPAGSAAANGGNFGTPLSGEEEVPPNNSRARGNAIFQLSADGTELSYKLSVANIENVFMAHIHMGPAGSNGPVVVWLYPSTTPGPGPTGQGRVDGVIAEGTITAANFINDLEGDPMSALVNLIKAGNAYVNVHTNDGVSPPNTGPGDLPGGEVRSQVEHRGH
jgi:hypothetical protein